MNRRKSFSEFELIDWIRRTAPAPGRHPLGIGDDCAILKAAASGRTVITTDMLLEGVHFEGGTPPYRIGWKAAARSLSDVAAMGCPASALTLCIVFHQGQAEPRFAREILRGLRGLCRRFDVPLVGGDVSSWRGPLALNVTALGNVTSRPPLLRSTARPGDRILVSGRLGGSILGHHLRFLPRLDLGEALNRRFHVHAMIDVSDGLAADLHHILAESRGGARLDARAVPISGAARQLARTTGRHPLDHALFDGEDYELLFTARPSHARRILSARLPAPVTDIGIVVDTPGMTLVQPDGREEALPARGYVHRLQ